MAKKRKRQAPRRNQPSRPQPVVVDQVEDDDPLDRMRFAAAAVHRAQREYLNSINAARDAGCSWVAIGHAVGVTRQAIQQRYATLERAFDAPAGSSPPEASA